MSQLDTNTITLNNILTKINNLPEKQNLSVVTATASDVLSPKVIVGPDGQPIVGTHNGGLKVATGTTSNWWKYDSTKYCISINAGIKAKYVILNIATSFNDSYIMPAALDQAYYFDNTYISYINFGGYYVPELYPNYLILTTGYGSEIPISNTESNIQFYFCASSATINFQDISWVVIGE